MIAGASWQWWLGFHAVVATLLLADAWMRKGLGDRSSSESPSAGRQPDSHPRRIAWLATAGFVLAAMAFAVWIALTRGRQPALEFVAGYTIETSLSVDNLFVFLLLFQGFEIDQQRQHKALDWGVWGAVVLRAFFIVAGVTLLERFDWITFLFGLFLLYAAWRLLCGGSARTVIPQWIRRLQPARESLLPVIIAVEFTDLLFATDSIPAVLAVTHNPFVAYTSNIAAVLGLRALYFAIADLLDRLRYLHYGLGALLGFVAFKMLAARWIEIPIIPSMIVIGIIVAVCAVASAAATRKEQGRGSRG